MGEDEEGRKLKSAFDSLVDKVTKPKPRESSISELYERRGPRAKVTYVNRKFGQLTAIAAAGHDRHRGLVIKCICDCGNEKFVRLSDLTRGKIKSCGCIALQQATNLNVKTLRRVQSYFSQIQNERLATQFSRGVMQEEAIARIQEASARIHSSQIAKLFHPLELDSELQHFRQMQIVKVNLPNLAGKNAFGLLDGHNAAAINRLLTHKENYRSDRRPLNTQEFDNNIVDTTLNTQEPDNNTADTTLNTQEAHISQSSSESIWWFSHLETK